MGFPTARASPTRATSLWALLLGISIGCGGSPPPTTDNHVPRVTSISPATAERGGPAFELTVKGAEFVESSKVRWDGVGIATRFVSPSELSAQVPAGSIRIAQVHQVSVVTPGPGGGTSNSVGFDVPCRLDPLGSATAQNRARLGAYYFDGWSGPLSNFHFAGLLDGGFTDREPISGWQDDSACAVEQQIVWARNSGFNFFLFDWYFNLALVDDTGEDLNSALKFLRAMPDRHGMQFALMYADGGLVDAASWTSVVAAMVQLMADPDYVRVGGKPLLVVYDSREMRRAFGSPKAVAQALDQLRATAQASGLGGVYVAGIPGGGAGEFSDLAADGYDAATLYGYPTTPVTSVPVDYELPFSALVESARWTWDQAVAASLPFLPVVVDGWDSRPWNGPDLVWYDRSPPEVATLIGEAGDFAESHPLLRPEPSPEPPLVLVEAWNEIGEGGFLVPTLGMGRAYVDAVAAVMTQPPTRKRTILSLTETPDGVVSGALTDATAAPISGAGISLTAIPVEGPGVITSFKLSGVAPPGAMTAVVGFRVNTEGGGPAPSDFSLYAVSYIQSSDGRELVPNADFSLGAQSWIYSGEVAFVPSDQSSGREMIAVYAAANQPAALTSSAFTITEGSQFEVSFTARVAPASTGSGYFTVIFLKAGLELFRTRLPLTGGQLPLGSAITDPQGQYMLSLPSIGATRARLKSTYDGDPQHWPAAAVVGP